MMGLFVLTFQRQNFFWALIAFICMQIIIKLIFDCLNFGHIKEYFRSKQNLMTEEEEMKYEYDRGYLDPEDKKYYEDTYLFKSR